MELFSNPSDDQIALMGCALALFVCGGLMYVSFFVGRLRQGSSATSTSTSRQPVTVKPTASEATATERKAA